MTNTEPDIIPRIIRRAMPYVVEFDLRGDDWYVRVFGREYTELTSYKSKPTSYVIRRKPTKQQCKMWTWWAHKRGSLSKPLESFDKSEVQRISLYNDGSLPSMANNNPSDTSLRYLRTVHSLGNYLEKNFFKEVKNGGVDE